MNLSFHELGDSLLVPCKSLFVPSKFLFILHLEVNNHVYSLALFTHLTARARTRFDHQLYNSLEPVKSLFWSHFCSSFGDVLSATHDCSRLRVGQGCKVSVA
jgi:hypothetical protein